MKNVISWILQLLELIHKSFTYCNFIEYTNTQAKKEQSCRFSNFQIFKNPIEKIELGGFLGASSRETSDASAVIQKKHTYHVYLMKQLKTL